MKPNPPLSWDQENRFRQKICSLAKELGYVTALEEIKFFMKRDTGEILTYTITDEKAKN